MIIWKEKNKGYFRLWVESKLDKVNASSVDIYYCTLSKKTENDPYGKSIDCSNDRLFAASNPSPTSKKVTQQAFLVC